MGAGLDGGAGLEGGELRERGGEVREPAGHKEEVALFEARGGGVGERDVERVAVPVAGHGAA